MVFVRLYRKEKQKEKKRIKNETSHIICFPSVVVRVNVAKGNLMFHVNCKPGKKEGKVRGMLHQEEEEYCLYATRKNPMGCNPNASIIKFYYLGSQCLRGF